MAVHVTHHQYVKAVTHAVVPRLIHSASALTGRSVHHSWKVWCAADSPVRERCLVQIWIDGGSCTADLRLHAHRGTIHHPVVDARFNGQVRLNGRFYANMRGKGWGCVW